ncbi:MAG: MBL fold metallo-hydrolase [Akkermansia sp.]
MKFISCSKPLNILGLLLLLVVLMITGIALYAWREIGESPDDYQKARFINLTNYQNGAFRYPSEFYPVTRTNSYVNPKDHKNLFFHILLSQEHFPQSPLPIQQLNTSSFNHPSENLEITWLGHSSMILDIDATRIMIDPVLGNAVPFPGIGRRFQASPIERDDLPKVDIVLISHNHYDHLERATIQAMIGKTRQWIVPLGLGITLEGWGCPREQIIELNWNEDYTLPNGLKITALPTRHYSARSTRNRCQSLWASYALVGPRHRVFYSGDGSYDGRFKQIGKQFGPFDLTLIETGAYNVRWIENHMFPQETVQAHLDLRGKYLMPVHWGAFDLAMHPWDESIKAIAHEVHKKQVKLITPIQGQRFVIGKTKTTPWWQFIQ